MTYQEINTMTEELLIPSAYWEFNDQTEMAPPFSVFYFPQDNDFLADNKNYQTISTLVWEIYTDYKDFILEAEAEKILTNYGLVWAKSEEYDDSQRLHMTRYTCDVVITEGQNNE